MALAAQSGPMIAGLHLDNKKGLALFNIQVIIEYDSLQTNKRYLVVCIDCSPVRRMLQTTNIQPTRVKPAPLIRQSSRL